MNRTRTVLLVTLFSAAGVAIYLGVGWFTGPDRSLLLPEGGAQWIRGEAPSFTRARWAQTEGTFFRRHFSVAEDSQQPVLRVRSFRSGTVFLNGQQIDSDAEELELSPFLRWGLNELWVYVENDRGPPALLAYSEELDLATPRDWWATDDGSTWTRATSLTDRSPFAISREFPSAQESLSRKLHYFAVLFLLGAFGGLLLGRYALAKNVRWVLVGAWVVLCANNVSKIPLDVGFDASDHYEYVQFIVENDRLPLATDGWAMFQSPLFYLLAALTAELARKCMEAESVSFFLRVLPMLCGLAQIEIAFRSSRIVFPERNDLQIIATIVGGFLPLNLYISQTVGNEPLSGCLTALLICCAFKLLAQPSSGSLPKMCGVLGLLFGLALLTKVSVMVLLPVVLLLIVYLSHSRGSSLGELILSTAVFFLSSGLIAGWYYMRNWILLERPFMGGWGVGRGFDWWQDPGFRVPGDLLCFGESLTYPVYSSLMGFWDGLYSTFWLDGFLSGAAERSVSPPWNYGFMISLTLLSIPLTAAGLAGIVLAFRRPFTEARRMCLFSVCCLGSFFVAMLLMFFMVPSYSAVKSSYALGLLPCFTVLITSGVSLIPRSTTSQTVLSGYMFSWLTFAYIAYFAW